MANLDKTITIQFRGDTVKFNDSINNINRMLRVLGNDIKDINKQIKLDPSNAENYANKMADLTERINLGKQALAEYQAQLEPLQRKIDAGLTLTDAELKQYENLQKRISETNNQIYSYNKELSETERIYNNLTNINIAKHFEEVSQKLNGISAKLKTFASNTSALSKGAWTLLTGAESSAVEFEDAMSNVRKVMTESDFGAGYFGTLKDSILEMSKTIPVTAKDISDVVANALQLGVASKDADKFAETMLRLGTSTNISADEAAIAIAQFYNIMGEDLSTVDKFGAALVDLGNNFPTFENDIMNMATRLASTSKNVGLSTQEVLGLSTALTSVGLTAENGGSAISSVFQNISKVIGIETKANKKKLAEFAKLTGMSGEEFKKAWNQDAFGTFQLIVEKLHESGEAGENLSTILANLGITNMRQVDSMQRLAQANDMFTEALNTANDAWEENDALVNESNSKYQNVASQIQLLKNKIYDLGVSFGEILLPYISEAIDIVGKIIEKFRDLPEPVKKIILGLLSLTAGISPLASAGSKITGSLSSVFDLFSKMAEKDTIGKVASAFHSFMGTSITSIFSGFKIPMIDYSGLFSIVDKIKNLPVTIMNAAPQIAKSIDGVFSGIVKKVKGFSFQGMFEGIKNSITGLAKGFSGLVNGITVGGVLGVIGLLIATFVLLYNTSDTFREKVNKLVEVLKNTLVSTFTSIQNKLIILWKYLQQAFIPVMEAISFAYNEYIKPALESMFESIASWLMPIIQTLCEWFKYIVQWLSDRIKPAIDVVASFIKDVVVPIVTTIISIFAKVVEWLAKIFKWIWNVIKPILEPIAKIILDVFGMAWDGVVVIIGWLIDKFSDLWQWLTDLWQTYLVDTGLVDAFGAAFETVGGIIERVAQGIGTIYGWFSDLIRKAREFLGLDDKISKSSAVRWSGAKWGNGGSSTNNVNNNVVINTTNGVSSNSIDRMNKSLGQMVMG